MYRILPAISSPSPIFPQFPALAYFSSPCPRVPRLLKRRASARLQRSEATPEGTSPRIRSTPHPRASRLRNNVACASTLSEERSDPRRDIPTHSLTPCPRAPRGYVIMWRAPARIPRSEATPAKRQTIIFLKAKNP